MLQLNDDFADEVAEWKRIGAAFDIIVEAPFELVVDGRSHPCVAYLPEFGTERGMLVRSGRPDVQFMDDAQTLGFGYAHVDLTTWPRGEQYIIEMLSDWGFNGANKPAWLGEKRDHSCCS
jgi:hypothetical protein